MFTIRKIKYTFTYTYKNRALFEGFCCFESLIMMKKVPDLQHWFRQWSNKNFPSPNPLLVMKGAVSRDFLLYFYFMNRSQIWAPDKQAKLVFLKDSFSRRYSRKI